MSLTVKNVLLLDNVDPAAEGILKENGIESTLYKEKLTEEALVAKLKDYDGVVIRSATKLNAEILQSCSHLKVIGRAGTGVDNIDIKAATNHGIIVMNTPGGNTLSAAEHTCTLICCMARNVPAANISMKEGKWQRKAFMGHELYGKTLAVVGLGRIGREVATRMQSFGMKTIGFDPMVSVESAQTSNIEWMKLEDIFPQADYITVHTPLIPQTRGLLSKETFAKCKKGVRVVNCARGGIIDENDLLEALQSGQCGGAGLDVFVEEPATCKDLIAHPNVIACPHLGASTTEAQSRCGREIAQQIVNICNGSDYFGVLNAPALAQVKRDDLKVTCDLAKSLGRIAAGMNPSKEPCEVVIQLSESTMKKAKSGVISSACVGLMGGNANVVNSASLAAKYGHKVTVEKAEASDDVISVTVKGESSSLKLTGRAAPSGGTTLLSADGAKFLTPVSLEDRVLFCRTTNKRDVIGKVLEQNMRTIHVSSGDVIAVTLQEGDDVDLVGSFTFVPFEQ